MITKYRYTLGQSIIETLDIDSIPANTAYDTIIISDEEIQAIETETLQIQKAEIAKQNQIALAQKLALENVVNQQQSLPDADALELQAIYPLWDGNFKAVGLNEKVQWFDANNELKLYRCEQPHTTEPTFIPYLTPALWTQIQPAGVVGVWFQPTGAQDAYQIDDLVHFPTINDPIYRSTTANNVWAPNVFGWVLN